MFLNFKKILIALFIFVSCFFIHNHKAEAKANIFDFEEHNSDIVVKYSNYRKTKGLFQAYIYGLSVVPKGIIVDDYLTKSDILEIKSKIGTLFMCRPDAPLRNWHGLPRGRDLDVEYINAFLEECRKANSKAILLCFYHPSLYFTGSIVERYKISGAINIVVDWEKSINIEYVGSGFDGGELTRGKNNNHTSVQIPWHVAHWPAGFIWNHTIVSNIEQEKYENSRKIRIDALSSLGYSQDEVASHIPCSPKLMDRQMFCSIYEKCIKKVVKFPECFNPKIPVVVTINLYGDKQHVFEIWESNS